LVDLSDFNKKLSCIKFANNGLKKKKKKKLVRPKCAFSTKGKGWPLFAKLGGPFRTPYQTVYLTTLHKKNNMTLSELLELTFHFFFFAVI
jgi:hypothetical protein